VDACIAANYRYFGDWQDLTPEQQAFLIGHYLSSRMIVNVQKDEEISFQNRQAKRGK